jgi:hypothetical protein
MASEKDFKIVSSLIEDIEDIPEVYMDGFRYNCIGGDEFPYTLHVAKYDEDWYEKTNQLIALTDEGIFVFNVVNDQARMTCYAYEDIIFLKRMDFAGYGRLTIKGTSNRKLFESTVEFDMKDRNLFEFIVVSSRLKERLPEALQEGDKADLTEDSYELLKLAYFRDSHPMLYGLATTSLLHEQKIKKTILQSKVFRKNLVVFRKRIARTHLVILTGEELIIIEEGRHSKKRPEVNDGGYWYYIPVSKIVSMDIKAEDGYLLILTVRLKERVSVELYFDSTLRLQLEQLVKSALSVYNEIKEES